MRALAAFVRSEDGQVWARTHERWGLDPAAFLEDEVLAYNFRVGLMLRLGRESEEEHPEARAFKAARGRSREQARQLAAALHG